MEDHFSYLKDLTLRGVVILAGPTVTNDYAGFGVVILKAENEGLAKEIMLKDPSVIHRVMRAEIYPFRISLFNPAGVEVTF
jgi:uncharacterized protein